MMKAHVRGYSRKDGTYVPPHERVDGHNQAHQAPVYHHPRLSENGHKVQIKNPTHPSSHTTWHNPKAVATFVPNGDVPASLNSIPLARWHDHPKTVEGWNYVDGINDNIDEPPMHVPDGKRAGSGVIIVEPDGRIWLVHPTNQFGRYETTFPKGTEEEGLSLQANACKEAYEESGLQVEITGFIGDFDRTTSVARMYWARRTGGTPVHTGWESQAVSLCPKEKLYDLLNMWPDHDVAENIGAGKPPVKPNKNLFDD